MEHQNDNNDNNTTSTSNAPTTTTTPPTFTKAPRQKKPKKIYHWLDPDNDKLLAKEEAISIRNAVRKFSKRFHRHTKAYVMFVLDISEESMYILKVSPHDTLKSTSNDIEKRDSIGENISSSSSGSGGKQKRGSVDIQHLYVWEKTMSATKAKEDFVQFLQSKKQEHEQKIKNCATSNNNTTSTTTTTTTSIV